MGNGQWAMGNGQWAMGNGQWALLSPCPFLYQQVLTTPVYKSLLIGNLTLDRG
ncbi:MAG: hypothetical protein KME30_27560 [Iphinoe sp. HA4291-MV1]|nr:hypothetical protein [Iphinoe sp. HA4291-MV1]